MISLSSVAADSMLEGNWSFILPLCWFYHFLLLEKCTFDVYCVLQIVSKDLSDPVRSHKDLDKDAAPFFKKAVKFYDGLAKQLVSQGHVLDLFASALDQVSFFFALRFVIHLHLSW